MWKNAHMVKACGFLLLAVTATATEWQFKDVRAPGAASGPRRYDVYGAVEVGRRTLAALYVLTADEKEFKRLRAEHGMTTYFALAWLSSTWSLQEVGERFFTWKENMVPQAADFTPAEETFAPPKFPRVLVRAAEEEGEQCPYLVAFPTQFACFNGELRVTARFGLPFVMNNLRVVKGEVWVVGVWEDHLIHRYDLEQRQLVEHRLPLEKLREAMGRAGIEGGQMASVASPGKELRQVRILPLEREPTTPEEKAKHASLRTFALPLDTLPTSFQYDVAVHGRSAAVLVRKPLGLWVTGWPDGGKGSFVAVKKEDLPALPGGATRLYLLGLEAVDKDTFFAAFEIHLPKTFAQWLVEDPAGALTYQKQQGREISPGEMAGGERALMGVTFDRDKVAERWFQTQSAMDKWWPQYTPIFSYRPGEVWMGIRQKKNAWIQGIGRLR